MKVLFVLNSLNAKGNGLARSARLTISRLKEAGVDVRCLTMISEDYADDIPEYPMEKFRIPMFQWLVEAHGFCFAASDAVQIRDAVAWADVIHIEEPFVLDWKVGREAKRQGKTCVGTCHIYPENVLFSLGLGWSETANNLLQKAFNHYVFDYCSDIQCPSVNIARRLEKSACKAELHVFSNGIEINDNIVASEPRKNPLIIACIGRYSREKATDVLLNAVPHIRHKDEIQLVFAGKGPWKSHLVGLANTLYEDGILKRKPQFLFCNKKGLRDLAHEAYLCIHCAKIEVEGLSLMEALSEGAVPVVAEGPLTATSQFALTERSRFPVGDSKALAERIDWWIEHPGERLAYGPRYVEAMKEYDIGKSIEKLVAMYEHALAKKG